MTTATTNKLTVNYGTGVTSCLSVRFSEACEYRRKHGVWPDEIDSSQQFTWYHNDGDGDLSPIFLGEYRKPDDMIESSFHHMWQFNWYDEIDVHSNSNLAVHGICIPSYGLKVRAHSLHPFVIGRTYVLYRGNDKAKEIDPTPYEAMEEMARQSGSTKFFLQTDDEDFYQFFTARFPDTTSLATLPRIKSNHDRYVMPVHKKKDFAFEFNAALMAAVYANGLITTTGNTGLWAVLYRGRLHNTLQYHGKYQTWRRLG